MDDLEALDAYQRCNASYAIHLAKTMDGDFLEWNGVTLGNPRCANIAKNLVIPLRPLSSEEAVNLAQVALEFYGKPSGWVLWTVHEQPDLSTGGFVQYPSTNPVMALPRSDFADVAGIEGFETRRVEDAAGVRLFEEIREIARGNEFPDDPEPGQFLDGRALTPDHRLWLGYLNGEPVATGAVFESDGVSMVKNIAVAPQHRRKGLGAAMSAHVTKMCDGLPVLDADPGSAPSLYRRLGYHDVGTLRFWQMGH